MKMLVLGELLFSTPARSSWLESICICTSTSTCSCLLAGREGRGVHSIIGRPPNWHDYVYSRGLEAVWSSELSDSGVSLDRKNKERCADMRANRVLIRLETHFRNILIGEVVQIHRWWREEGEIKDPEEIRKRSGSPGARTRALAIYMYLDTCRSSSCCS